MAKVTISFTLDDQTDQDIAAWLNGLPRGERSSAIRDALRDHLQKRNVTLADVYHEVSAIRRKLDKGIVATQESNDEPEEPPELAAALDNLGL